MTVARLTVLDVYLAGGSDNEPGPFKLQFDRIRQPFARTQLKTTRRAPQVRLLNWVLGLPAPLQNEQPNARRRLTPPRTFRLSFGHEIPVHFPRTSFNREEHCRMPIDCKRIQKRTPATVALQIISAKQPFITELAFAENVSLHGVRAVTERAWKPGERVIVKSYHGSIQSAAKVIYCHRLAEARYAVGLELRSAVGTWVDVPQSPRIQA